MLFGSGLCTSKGDSISLGGIWPTVEFVCVVGAFSSEVLHVDKYLYRMGINC